MKATRVINGLLSLGLVSAVAGLSFYAPKLEVKIGQPPAAIAQQVKAKNLSIDCPGSAYQFGGKSGTSVSKIEQLGETTVSFSADLTAGGKLRTATLGSAGSQVITLPGGQLISNQFAAKNANSFKVLDSTGKLKQSAGLLSASQVQVLDEANLKGLVATACTTSKSQQWILGAEAITGRDGTLILVNSANIDSTVALEIYTDAGLVTKGGLNGISVPKHSAVAIAIATLAPKAPTSAIKISSSGAAISAWVQQKTVRGILAAGADLIAAATDASKQLVIPGLMLRNTKDSIYLSRSNEDYFDVEPTLDVFVPGSKPATITVQVLGSDQQSFGTVINQTVSAGRVARLSIEGLGNGDYTLFIESDQPVQSVARFSHSDRKATPNSDFAYLPAVGATKQVRAINTTHLGTTNLMVANGGTQTATVRLTNRTTGKVQSFSLGNLDSKVIKLQPDSSYALESSEPTAATAIISDGVYLGSIALDAYQNLGKEISVAVR